MSREFEMSMMGELQFFLGLQIKQVKDGTFVHQAKYMKDMLKKFDMNDSKPMSTPMSTTTTLDADEDGDLVDQKEYRSMIGSLLYLTATRPDIQFNVSVRSFSGFTEDFTSAGRQYDIQIGEENCRVSRCDVYEGGQWSTIYNSGEHEQRHKR